MNAGKPVAISMALAMGTLSGACGGGGGPHGVTVRRTAAGDTVVFTSMGVPDTVTIDSVHIVWRSDSIGQPTTMALDGDRLIVGDRTQVHILTLAGSRAVGVMTVGRDGDGPGEYRSIYAVGAFGPDSLSVYDTRSQRLTWLSATGELLGSRTVTPHPPWINPVSGQKLVRWGGGVLLEARGSVRVGAPNGKALIRVDPTNDSASVVREWDGPPWVRLGDVYGPRRLFGPAPMMALGPGPLLASGDGLEYCVTLSNLSGQAHPRRLCRDRARTPVGGGIRHPDLSVLDSGSIALRIARAVVEHEEVPDVLPSYDDLLVGSSGVLWVRTMGTEVADVLPTVRSFRPELGPKYRYWDVFDTNDGRVVRTLAIPSTFDPRVVTPEAVYGFDTLPTGEIAIASLTGLTRLE